VLQSHRRRISRLKADRIVRFNVKPVPSTLGLGPKGESHGEDVAHACGCTGVVGAAAVRVGRMAVVGVMVVVVVRLAVGVALTHTRSMAARRR